MPPNTATIHGRDGIQKFWGAFFDGVRVKLTLTAEEVEGRGDLAYSRGGYALDLTPKAQGRAPEHDKGKFLVIYRRQPDGIWRVAVDMYSSDLPVPK
jgi:ketosteroid isomerase-like protein